MTCLSLTTPTESQIWEEYFKYYVKNYAKLYLTGEKYIPAKEQIIKELRNIPEESKNNLELLLTNILEDIERETLVANRQKLCNCLQALENALDVEISTITTRDKNSWFSRLTSNNVAIFQTSAMLCKFHRHNIASADEEADTILLQTQPLAWCIKQLMKNPSQDTKMRIQIIISEKLQNLNATEKKSTLLAALHQRYPIYSFMQMRALKYLALEARAMLIPKQADETLEALTKISDDSMTASLSQYLNTNLENLDEVSHDKVISDIVTCVFEYTCIYPKEILFTKIESLLQNLITKISDFNQLQNLITLTYSLLRDIAKNLDEAAGIRRQMNFTQRNVMADLQPIFERAALNAAGQNIPQILGQLKTQYQQIYLSYLLNQINAQVLHQHEALLTEKLKYLQDIQDQISFKKNKPEALNNLTNSIDKWFDIAIQDINATDLYSKLNTHIIELRKKFEETCRSCLDLNDEAINFQLETDLILANSGGLFLLEPNETCNKFANASTAEREIRFGEILKNTIRDIVPTKPQSEDIHDTIMPTLECKYLVKGIIDGSKQSSLVSDLRYYLQESIKRIYETSLVTLSGREEFLECTKNIPLPIKMLVIFGYLPHELDIPVQLRAQVQQQINTTFELWVKNITNELLARQSHTPVLLADFDPIAPSGHEEGDVMLQPMPTTCSQASPGRNSFLAAPRPSTAAPRPAPQASKP